MGSGSDATAGESLDRRAFLIGLGGAGLALAGCGGSSSATHTGSGTRATTTTRTTIPKPVPRSLKAAIRGQVIERGDPGFTTAAHVYDPRFDDILPTAVARPIDARDVQSAIRYTVANGVQVRARSGGHSYAGYSTLRNGVVLDLRNMNSIRVDRAKGVAIVGAGAQLIDISAALHRRARCYPSARVRRSGSRGSRSAGGSASPAGASA